LSESNLDVLFLGLLVGLFLAIMWLASCFCCNRRHKSTAEMCRSSGNYYCGKTSTEGKKSENIFLLFFHFCW